VKCSERRLADRQQVKWNEEMSAVYTREERQSITRDTSASLQGELLSSIHIREFAIRGRAPNYG